MSFPRSKLKVINVGSLLSIVFLLVGIFFFGPTLLVSNEDLVVREGEIDIIDIKYEKKRGRFGSMSMKSTLQIKLTDYNKYFSIYRNIGQEFYDPNYGDIKLKLKDRNYAKIWIKKDEVSAEPKVYQISDFRGKILYSIDEAKKIELYSFYTTLVLGSIFILFGIYKKKQPLKT